MISVAMTSYNGEKYILEQLNSIFHQSIKPNEVIICDDGSTDNTIHIIKAFIRNNGLENQWKLVRNCHSLGFIKNFLKAISLTNGDIIFLSDQDDIFLSNKFETMLNYFKQYPECMVLNANYSMMDGESNKIDNYRLKPPNRGDNIRKLDFKTYLYYSNFPGFSMAFRKEVKNDIEKLDLNNIYGHDILINLIGLAKNGCFTIPEILSYYRLHSLNTSDVGGVISNLSIDSRIIQKNRELHEYAQLKNFIAYNHLDLDIAIILNRENILKKRIKYLNNKNIFNLIKLLLFTNVYPKKTILGDILYIIKRP